MLEAIIQSETKGDFGIHVCAEMVQWSLASFKIVDCAFERHDGEES